MISSAVSQTWIHGARPYFPLPAFFGRCCCCSSIPRNFFFAALSRHFSCDMSNPFDRVLTELKVGDETVKFYDLDKLNDPRVASLPLSIKVVLEAAIRNCDNESIFEADVEKILDWKNSATKVEIPFKCARVLMQVPSMDPLYALYMLACLCATRGLPSVSLVCPLCASYVPPVCPLQGPQCVPVSAL